MKDFRANLTRLKNTIDAKLPDGEDIFGYSGISKKLLSSALEKAHGLSRAISDVEESGVEKLEIVSLKRHGSRLFSSLNEFLDKSSDSDKARKKFDYFLNELSDLLDKVKFTYVVAAQNGLKFDEDYQEIREAITKLTEEEKKLLEVSKSVDERTSTLSEKIVEIETAHEALGVQMAKFDKWESSGEAASGRIEKIAEEATEWDETIDERDSRLSVAEKRMEALQTEVAELKRELSSIVSSAEEIREVAKLTADENVELNRNIERVLGDANRVGMAGSFKDRKEEIDRTHKLWQLLFVFTVIIISCVSFWFFQSDSASEGGSIDWATIVMRLTIISPLVWLAWFSARQYGILNRVREDYGFKYASAMAYEGFKNASRETDPELEKSLLELSIFNMTQNPIRLIDGQFESSSPAEEFGANISKRVGRVKTVTVAEPSGSKITADLETEEK